MSVYTYTYICVCVKRMMNYICGEIYQVERVNIIETAMGRHIYDVYALWHTLAVGTICGGEWSKCASRRRAQEGSERARKKERKKRENWASSRLIGMSSELNGTQTQLGPSSWCRVQVNKKSSHILASWMAAIQRDLQTSVCPAQSTISQQRCTILESALHACPCSAFFFYIPLSLCTVHAKINCLAWRGWKHFRLPANAV